MTTAMRLKEEGKIEGKIEDKIEITKKMIQKGYSTEEIAEITGFEIEKIEAVRAELKI